MFHVKRHTEIKSFSDAKWMKKRAAGKIKSFLIQQFFKNVGEVWASSPHLRSKLFCNKFSLLQLHSLKLSNSNKVKQCESKLQIRTRQRGNCSMLAGKSRGGTPFCRMLKTVFPKSSVSHEILQGDS